LFFAGIEFLDEVVFPLFEGGGDVGGDVGAGFGEEVAEDSGAALVAGFEGLAVVAFGGGLLMQLHQQVDFELVVVLDGGEIAGFELVVFESAAELFD
jgi:hypothetical protein